MTHRDTPPYRIAVWSTGAIGSIVIRHVLTRSGHDLVAVWVHDEAKRGRDVGDLLGLPTTGVTTTSAVEDVVAAAPDCVIYASASPELDAAYLPHYVELLGAGIDVITVSTPGLMFPPGFDARSVARLSAAARSGGATLYASGMEPGFAGDQLVALLTTLSGTVSSIRTQEIFRYDEYANEFLMRDVFGFGMALDETPLMQLGGSQLMAWGPPVEYVAAALGVTLDGIRETYERLPTPRDLDVAMGRIAAGTAGAVRMETIGVVDGEDLIVIEHVNRMAPDLAPEWPDADRDGTYRIVITGEPNLTCELTLGHDPAEATEHGLIGTAMRLLNAVPHVVRAAPGLVSSLDLPLTVPQLGTEAGVASRARGPIGV